MAPDIPLRCCNPSIIWARIVSARRAREMIGPSGRAADGARVGGCPRSLNGQSAPASGTRRCPSHPGEDGARRGSASGDSRRLGRQRPRAQAAHPQGRSAGQGTGDFRSTKKCIHARRMRIEETIRDLRSHRSGFELRCARTRCPERLEALLPVAALASFIRWRLGLAARHRQWVRHFQANTERCRTVVSIPPRALDHADGARGS